jgi:uncharacterized protein (TIGR02594 family)
MSLFSNIFKIIKELLSQSVAPSPSPTPVVEPVVEKPKPPVIHNPSPPPSPTPVPTPEPVPSPTPTPEPVPVPTPEPVPSPTPTPEPVPTDVEKPNPPVIHVPSPSPSSTQIPPWMKIGISLMGTEETPGGADNPIILDWADQIGGPIAKDYNADSIPWCGLFVGFCLTAAKQQIVKTPLWARSWASYGISVEPAFGAILDFIREGGGHVGFYVSEDDQYYHVLGGNQSDAVNVTRVAKNRCIGIRWPAGAEQYLKKGRIIKQFDGKISSTVKKTAPI